MKQFEQLAALAASSVWLSCVSLGDDFAYAQYAWRELKKHWNKSE